MLFVDIFPDDSNRYAANLDHHCYVLKSFALKNNIAQLATGRPPPTAQRPSGLLPVPRRGAAGE
jgi:hypothetical protein